MFHKLLNIKLSISVVVLMLLLSSTYGELRKERASRFQAEKTADAYKQFAENFVGTRVDTLKAIRVSATSYNPNKKCCGNNKAIGSSGELVTPGVIAISHDLKNVYGIKYGDIVVLDGYGKFTVKDLMDKRFTRRVDILSLVPQYSKKFGIKHDVVLYFSKES